MEKIISGGECEFSPLKEKELIKWCLAGRVKHLRLEAVQQDDRFSFQMFVGLKADKVGQEVLVLMTYKGVARLWNNLDRCMTHIRDNYGFRGVVHISGKIHF